MPTEKPTRPDVSTFATRRVEREAREVFPATVVPRDFDLVTIPFAERGVPELVKRGARLPRQAET